MKRASKRIILTSENVNRYGFRVLTDGIDLTQYGKNPLMLWMHIPAFSNDAETTILALSKNPMKFLNKMLATFDYHSWAEFGQSLLPSSKYGWTVISAGFSLSIFPFVDRVFGLDAYAFAVLILVFIAELTSGLIAASICKEAISSMKLSRFSFKVFYYLVLISLPYVMAESFKLHGKAAAAFMFDWLHLFLLAQIILENVVSILENLAVISGKDKTHWIAKIQQKFNNLIS